MESANPTPRRYAGFWRRLTAYGIDATIVQLLTAVVMWFLPGEAHAQTLNDALQPYIDAGLISPGTDTSSLAALLQANGASGTGGMLGWQAIVIWLVISGFYNIAFTAGRWQATPGKHWCGLTTIRDNGKPIGWVMSAIRWIGSGTSWLPMGLGYFLIAVTPEKTAMHDAICGTRVVYR